MSKKINSKIFRKRTLQLTIKTHKILFLAEIIINDVVHSTLSKNLKNFFGQHLPGDVKTEPNVKKN